MYSNIATNAIILENKQVLLTLRRDKNLWCLPGGMVEPLESIEKSLLREIKEEILVNGEIKQFVGIYSNANLKLITPSTRYIIVLVFHCLIDGIPQTSNEVAKVDFFDIDKLPDNLIETHRERILDCLSKSLPVIK